MDSLFETKLLSHRDDPETSKEAAQKMIESGKLSYQEDWVMQGILQLTEWVDDFTAKELCVSGIKYHVIQRRLSGLHRKGKIERTGQKRNGCAVWKLK
jgi:hypothetical protein